ncbi:MAG TPA: hypothetical protein PKX48_04165 [Planctomycetota bacterium]|nr:hypothetical protein [Planctomycetota bacterium]OQC21421.1 MAG: hypothetical protein BWX69_00907 [Planctomycetes bacterium ADurb.Bin069]HNR97817.1 hypothetical protein [Planctomycetota bacterium]HNU24716.1 hypothetical protein [Planctomycetota bacterium]HOE29918.1 hypothetical protein [Planctomycetota bacterium]
MNRSVLLRSLGLRLGAALALACSPGCGGGPLPARDGVPAQAPGSGATPTLGPPMVYELGAADAEVVAIAFREGQTLLYVTSPGAACGGRGDNSFLSLLVQPPEAPRELEEIAVLDLGLGEATSVAVHPRGDFAVVARKNPQQPDTSPGCLQAVAGHRVVGRVAVGVGPDSVAVAPNGRFAVVACEGQVPDAEDCPEDGGIDAAGSIVVVDLRKGPAAMTVAATVEAAEIFERFFKTEPDRARVPEDIEPEFVAIAPDSSFALVTLQEQSAVAVVTLREAPAGSEDGGVFQARLADVILLPHGFRDASGRVRGVHPDGIAISPDGALAVTANESHSKARHLQGLSILDLRAGPERIKAAATHPVFELDSSLSAAKTEKTVRKLKRKSRGAAAAPLRAKPKTTLPRLDPEGIALARWGTRMLAALAIERRAAREEAGSVLILDITDALAGAAPARIGRTIVGATESARPETLAFSPDGRYLFVAAEGDGGTITMIEIGA